MKYKVTKMDIIKHKYLKIVLKYIHPSIIYTTYPMQGDVGLELTLSDTGREAGCSLSQAYSVYSITGYSELWQ